MLGNVEVATFVGVHDETHELGLFLSKLSDFTGVLQSHHPRDDQGTGQ